MPRIQLTKEKKQNFFKECGLLLLLIITGAIFSVLGFLKSQGDADAVTLEKPYLAAVFSVDDGIGDELGMDSTDEGIMLADSGTEPGGDIADGSAEGDVIANGSGADIDMSGGTGGISNSQSDTQTGIGQGAGADTNTDAQTGTGHSTGAGTNNDAQTDTQTKTQEEIENETPGIMQRERLFEEIEPWSARSAYYDDGFERPLTTRYPYVSIDSSYYDDALFIGDSRIEGLHDYGGLDNATFAYKTGVSVFKIQDETLTIAKGTDYSKGSLYKACTGDKYKKIFIMIGVNELAKGYSYQYVNKYIEMINLIREYAPDAVIEIMGIMYLTQKYSDGSDYFNNDNINCRNTAMVRALPDDEKIIYLDMNECVSDETGGALNPELTKDGLHLSAQYYYLWADWLNEHGLQDEMFTLDEVNSES
ncbi:MAG: hypothetical protein KBS85_03340 [Lachnospiraceae bacterium]|nr:hypothetical protein [Candidatus Merdinaster equi]